MKLERSYTQQIRKVTADMARIATVRAAIELLSSSDAAKFSMDTIASRAGVSRMTVFNMFGDKRTLLIAVYDALSQAGQLDDITDILNTADIDTAWVHYVQRFAQFYQTNSLTLQRLRGMAALDADFDAVMRQRDEKRHQGICWLLQRELGRSPTRPPSKLVAVVSQQISALMGFEVLRALTQCTDAAHAVVLWTDMVNAMRGLAHSDTHSHRKQLVKSSK
jgi:AcrR family transcriptional regulator